MQVPRYAAGGWEESKKNAMGSRSSRCVLQGWFSRAATCVLGVLLALGTGYAQTAVSPEEAKAAYLHRFAGFVEWPASSFPVAGMPIVVGLAGAPGVRRALLQVAHERPVQHRALHAVELTEPREGADVHILMIGAGAWKRAAEWLAAVKGRPVLVVTDMPEGLARGAALCLVDGGERLRFEASVPAAEAAGLRLSARLLVLAERVVRAP